MHVLLGFSLKPVQSGSALFFAPFHLNQSGTVTLARIFEVPAFNLAMNKLRDVVA
jgi:hypothetical protein